MPAPEHLQSTRPVTQCRTYMLQHAVREAIMRGLHLQATFRVCSAQDLYSCDAGRGPMSAARRVLTAPGVGYFTKIKIFLAELLLPISPSRSPRDRQSQPGQETRNDGSTVLVQWLLEIWDLGQVEMPNSFCDGEI